MSRRALAGLACIAIAATGCADAGGSAATREAIHIQLGPVDDGTDASAGEGRSEVDRALTVVLAGDSIMGDTAPAALTALGTAEPSVAARFELLPAIPRTLLDLQRWSEIVDADPPDVLVLLIGIWEAATVESENGVDTPGWAERYRQDVLEPWFGHLAERGIETIWVGMAPIREPEINRRVQTIMGQVAAVAAERSTVVYVPGDDALASLRGYTDSLPDASGGFERVRRADGLHLCPPGAERMTDLIVDALGASYGIEVTNGWQSGAWRAGVLYDKDLECPES